MNNSETKKTYNRYMNRIDSFGMAFGCMVGWGALVMPGTTFLPVAGLWGSIIAMIIGAVFMLVIANNYAYLINRYPGAGGVYTYTKQAFGRDHAFLSSWFLCLSYLTIVFLNGTALFVVLKTIFGDHVQTGMYYIVSGNKIDYGELLTSVIALTGVGLIYILTKPILQKLQTLMSVVMIISFVTLTAICLPHAVSSGAFKGFVSQSTQHAYGIFSIVFLAPWAYVGFDAMSFDTVHFKFNIKHSKTIMFIGIAFACFAYSAMNVVAVSVVPDGYESWSAYISDIGSLSGFEAVPTFYAAKTLIGPAGISIIGIAALCAVLTGIIGGYRVATHVLLTMAEDKILSEKFNKTTHNIVFVMILSVSLALLGRNTLGWFVDLTSFGAIVAFLYTSAVSYKLAKDEGNKRIKITGLIGTVVSGIFVVVQLVPNVTVMETMGCEAFLLLSFWCLLGFVFYWRTIIRNDTQDNSGMSTSGVILFSLLLYSAIMWLAKLLVSKESLEEVRNTIMYGGAIMLVIIFTGLVIMLYLQDLVRKKHAQAELAKVRAEEISLAKSRFLFNMSHDIRTPMNAIIGYTELALNEPASPELKNYLGKISRSNRHLLNLINDILEMSRIETGHLEIHSTPSDICVLFDEVYDLFEQQMKQKKIDFVVDTKDVNDRFVLCDEKSFNRVICNLISNAYKFTPENGSVSAIVKQTKIEDGFVCFEISIRDSGIGMSKEFAENMFSPFERERTSTVSEIEGTGLGLSITKRIVDAMGGTINVETEKGKGTNFIISISFELTTEDKLSKKADKEELSEKLDFTKFRLLIAEDNEINLEIAKMILSKSGFKLETAQNGKVAFEKVSASEPGYYDAVLMDIQMPVMDGFTATKKIRALENKELAEIPILAMTANAFKEDEEAALAAGMQAHIAKPLDVPVLLKTLTEVLLKNQRKS